MNCELLKQRLIELEKRRFILDHKDRFTLEDNKARDRLSYEINKTRNILRASSLNTHLGLKTIERVKKDKK